MQVYKPSSYAFKVLLRTRKSIIAKANPDLANKLASRSVAVAVNLDFKNSIKSLKKKLKDFDKKLSKLEKLFVKTPSKLATATVASYKDMLLSKHQEIKQRAVGMKVDTTHQVDKSDEQTAAIPLLPKDQRFYTFLKKGMGIDAISYEEREIINQMKEMLPKIKNKKRREAIKKELDGLLEEVNKRMTKFNTLIEKVAKGSVYPSTIKTNATMLINELQKNSVAFKISRLLVPAALSTNVIRFATYIKLAGIPAVDDPNVEGTFIVALFFDVNTSTMSRTPLKIRISKSYIDPRDLDKSDDVVTIKQKKTASTARIVHNYLLTQGYYLIKRNKTNVPSKFDTRLLPPWLKGCVKIEGRVVTVDYKVASHPTLGDRVSRSKASDPKPFVMEENGGYVYQGSDARLIKSAGGWYYTATEQLYNAIFMIINDQVIRRASIVYTLSGHLRSHTARGKMDPKTYKGVIPLTYTIIRKK